MFDFLRKFLAGSNEKEIARIQKTVDRINAQEMEMQKLTDDQTRKGG